MFRARCTPKLLLVPYLDIFIRLWFMAIYSGCELRVTIVLRVMDREKEVVINKGKKRKEKTMTKQQTELLRCHLNTISYAANKNYVISHLSNVCMCVQSWRREFFFFLEWTLQQRSVLYGISYNKIILYISIYILEHKLYKNQLYTRDNSISIRGNKENFWYRYKHRSIPGVYRDFINNLKFRILIALHK